MTQDEYIITEIMLNDSHKIPSAEATNILYVSQSGEVNKNI